MSQRCLYVLFCFFSAKNSAWQLLHVHCMFVMKPILRESTYLIHALLNPLPTLFLVLFPTAPWGRHCRDRLRQMGSTAGQLGWNPCSIANQRWAQGQQSSVFPKSHDPLSKKSREIEWLLFTTIGCTLSGPAWSSQVSTGRSVSTTALNLGFKSRLI